MGEKIRKMLDGKDFTVKNILDKIKSYKKKIVKTIVILMVLAVVGVGVAGGSLYAYTKSKTNYSLEQMEEIALGKIPGEVIKSHIDINEDDLTLNREFKIKDKSNMLREITVNSNSGAIVDFDDENGHDRDDRFDD